MALIQATGSKNHHIFNLEVYENGGSQNINNNTTTINYSFYLTPKVKGYNWSSMRTMHYTITINGVDYTGDVPSSYDGSSTLSIATGSGIPIEHNADGSKTISFSFSVQDNGSASYTTGSASNYNGSLTLTTIPRASTIGNVTGYIDSDISISWTRATTSFKHKLYYSLDNGSTKTLIAENLDTSHTWKPDESLIDTITDTDEKIGTIYLRTYNGTTYIGEKSATLTLKIPESVIPTITDDECTFTNAIETIDTIGLVQGISNLKAHLVGSGVRGSTIIKYVVETPDGTLTENDTYVLTPISTSGDYEISYYVEDSRGRKSAVITKTLSVYEYSPPVIEKYSVERENDDGEEYLDFDVKAKVYNLDGKNTFSAYIYYKKKTESTWSRKSIKNDFSLDGLFKKVENVFYALVTADDEYDTYIKIDDFLSAPVIKEVEVGTSFVLMDFHNSGTGIAFGKVAQEENTIEVDDCITFKYHGKEVGSGGGIPINSIVEYDGTEVPDGYQEYTEPTPTIQDGGNSWKKVEYDFYTEYFKNGSVASASYSANGWGGITICSLPTGISFNYNTMSFSAEMNCGDAAIICSARINSGGSVIYGSWQNKYGGSVTASITYHFLIRVYK